MTVSSSVRKIIWSVDAFEESSQIQTHVLHTLRNLAIDSSVSIEPVYVLSPEQLDVSLEFTPPWIKHYRPAAQKALEQKVKAIEIPGVEPPKVLVNTRASLRDSVRALTSYAKANGASLIVVGSHGRSGLDRILLGSFAESLLLQSKVPVLVVNATAKSTDQLSPILFPTDFSEGAFPVFTRVLKLAKDLKSKVTIFHAIPNPIEPVFQSGVYLLGGGWVPVPTFLEREEKRLRELAEQWLDRAAKYEVPLQLVLDRESHGVVESILKHVKQEKIGMIAMAAQSGPVASVLIGSICRQMVRCAPCPVWVLRKDGSS